MRAFTDTEKAILRLVQGDIPDGPAPYADMAAQVGVTEEVVLALLRELKENGAIRRFGATLKHQKAGYTHNVMVAWKVDEDAIVEAGEKAATSDYVSHCYHRAPRGDWPYSLFTMVHGTSPEHCAKVIDELSSLLGMDDYALLTSKRELKKTSMVYF